MEICRNFKNAIRNLTRRGQHNAAKILCLGIGLAISSVIIAEIYFEQSFDTFFPGYQRTYIVNEDAIQNGDYEEYPQTSGAIAPGIKQYVPQVEAATRYTDLFSDVQCDLQSQRQFTADIQIADSCFFDVFPRQILQGNAKDVLSRPFYCMVSSRIAKKIGGNVVGKRFTLKECPGIEFVIGGVYKEFPYNSSLHNMAVILSMPTMRYITYDGSRNWVGNDRYHSYIRLAKGHTPEEIKGEVEKMRQEKLPLKELKKAGVSLNYSFTQISKAYTSDPYIKKMGWIMSIMAFVLLMSSVMNYLLIIIGNMISRSREMAIRKCYGASKGRIIGIIFSEATVHVILALILAALILIACKGSIEQLISAPLRILLFNRGSWILGAIVLIILAIGGLVPGLIYSSIPVTTAFRGYRGHNSRWKQVLLAIQFTASALLLSLLLIIHLQYNYMVNDSPGYDYSQLAVLNIDGATPEQYDKCITELKRIPQVDQISTASRLLTEWQSGNDIKLPGDDKEYLNVADLYSVSDGYLKLMDIPIVQGRNFTEHTDSLREVMVSHSFVNRMKKAAHWTDNVVGKKIMISEHSDSDHDAFTICGIYGDFRIGSISQPDTRPSIMFYSKHPSKYIMIRFHQLTADAMKSVHDQVKELFPDRNITLQSYSTMIANLYISQNHFRSGVMAAGAIAFLIALFGLVGYVNDEVNQRHKEIAIRKVNGAQVKDILRIFIKDTFWIALPSLIIGGTVSYFISRNWLESFSQRISLNPILFVGCIILLAAIIAAVVIANCYRVARENPEKYLKQE